MSSSKVVSIQIGEAKEHVDEDGKTWTSAIEKKPISGSAHVLKLLIEGDHQVDTKHHGGEDKAVLIYSSDHFPAWSQKYSSFAEAQSLSGAFGENLTILGQQESEVCIGDIFHIGTTTVQVSQPRQPCWKLSKLWKLPKLAVEVQKTGRTGWYLRVLEEGKITAGDNIKLVDRPHAEWTVTEANRVMYAKPRSPSDDLRLARCETLSEAWRTQLNERSRDK